MNAYGKVLGTTLPLTATGGYALVDGANPFILGGFLSISALSLVMVTAYFSRYLINRK